MASGTSSVAAGTVCGAMGVSSNDAAVVSDLSGAFCQLGTSSAMNLDGEAALPGNLENINPHHHDEQVDPGSQKHRG